MEIYLPEIDLRTCSAVNSAKRPDFGGLKTNQRHKFRLDVPLTCPTTCELRNLRSISST